MAKTNNCLLHYGKDIWKAAECMRNNNDKRMQILDFTFKKDLIDDYFVESATGWQVVFYSDIMDKVPVIWDRNGLAYNRLNKARMESCDISDELIRAFKEN